MSVYAHIVATTPGGIIGVNNQLPWKHHKQDMLFFREKTMNHVVIMGYNTVLSLPKKLGGRFIVGAVNSTGSVLAGRFCELIDQAAISVDGFIKDVVIPEEYNQDIVYIAGGAKVYHQTLKDVSVVFRNIIFDPEGLAYDPQNQENKIHYYPLGVLDDYFTLIHSEVIGNKTTGGPWFEKQIWVRS